MARSASRCSRRRRPRPTTRRRTARRRRPGAHRRRTTVAPTEVGGSDGASSASTVQNAADVSDGATWLGRVLSTLGLAILFGSFVLIVVAWPEGPEYILAVRFLRSVWILTFAGTLLYVIALSAAVNDESLGTGLNPGTWLDLLDAGWPGRAAIARLVLVIATGWVVLRPERVIDPTTQLPALAIPDARRGDDRPHPHRRRPRRARRGRRASSTPWRWRSGSAAWCCSPGSCSPDRARRTSCRPCAGSGASPDRRSWRTVVSGLVQLYRLDGGSLFSEGHGRVLVVKTVFVAIMLFVGLTARQVAQQRLTREPDLTPPTADRLRRAFGTEAIIGLVVIGLSGWLMSFTPPKVTTADDADYAVEEPFVDEPSGIDLVVQLYAGAGRRQPAAGAGERARDEPERPRHRLHPAAGLGTGRGLAADRPDRRRRGAVRTGVPAARRRRPVDDAGRRDDADRAR